MQGLSRSQNDAVFELRLRVLINQRVHADRVWPDPFLCRITELTGSMVAGAGVNPAEQRWGWM